jgi:hypothetical protein
MLNDGSGQMSNSLRDDSLLAELLSYEEESFNIIKEWLILCIFFTDPHHPLH